MEKQITINVPDGKTEKITKGDDGIHITWIDKVTPFNEYVKQYNRYKNERTFPFWTDMIVTNPSQWPIQDKFGLLQMIADDLNGGWTADWMNQDQAKYLICYDQDNKAVTSLGRCYVQIPTSYFSKEAAQKAIGIIPKDFIKSFN